MLLSNLTAASLPSFSRLDSLFLAAASGEPRFAGLRDSAEKALLADSGLLDYLLERNFRDQTPRQRQYVERLFVLRSDSGRRAGPRLRIARALPALGDTARAQWLLVGSRLGDSAFRAVARPWATDSFAPARRAALRSLGAYPDPSDLPLLWERLEASRGLERQQCLWALDAQGPLRDWKRLLPLLADEDAYNRRKARDLLLKATDSSWAVLASAMPKNPGRPGSPEGSPLLLREWRLLALGAKDGRKFLASQAKAMTKEERRFFGVDDE